MKLVTFVHGEGVARAGVLIDETVFDLLADGFESTLEFLEAGDAAVARAKARVEAGKEGIALSQIRLLSPIPRPPRVFGVGLNYAEHAAESQMKVQVVPTVFLKLSSTVVGPDVDVVLPHNATQSDYEAELAVVIGTAGYRIAAVDAEK